MRELGQGAPCGARRSRRHGGPVPWLRPAVRTVPYRLSGTGAAGLQVGCDRHAQGLLGGPCAFRGRVLDDLLVVHGTARWDLVLKSLECVHADLAERASCESVWVHVSHVENLVLHGARRVAAMGARGPVAAAEIMGNIGSGHSQRWAGGGQPLRRSWGISASGTRSTSSTRSRSPRHSRLRDREGCCSEPQILSSSKRLVNTRDLLTKGRAAHGTCCQGA